MLAAAFAHAAPLEKKGGIWMFEVREFAADEKMDVEWKAVERHFSAKKDGFQFSFVAGLPYLSVNGQIVKLAARTVLEEDGKIWVPLTEAAGTFEKSLGKFKADTTAKVFKAETKKGAAATSSAAASSANKTEEKANGSAKTAVADDRKAKAGSREVKTIVLDPGHGGKDSGALGKKSAEKDIVLAVAKKLKARLEKEGFEVKLTRSKDVFIELGERPNLANKWNGDLFISLHCNAIEGEDRQKRTEGYHFYVLRAPESEEDKAIARRENKVATLYGGKGKAEISPVEWIKINASLEHYQKNSFKFTEHLLKSFEGGHTKRLGTGAGGAGFMVLVGALMPAVLVELGFITHPTDEAFMMSEKGQNELADQISKAVTAYRETVHQYRETLAH